MMFPSLGLDADPCVCGDTTTWHPGCYQGLTQQQIDAKYREVFKMLRKRQKDNAARFAEELIRKAGEGHE